MMSSSCPVCGQASAGRRPPFCSKRCADVDPGRWLNGACGLPADVPEERGEAAEAIAKEPSHRH